MNDHLSVTILDAERCYRYVGAVVENVRIKPSPRWLRERDVYKRQIPAVRKGLAVPKF